MRGYTATGYYRVSPMARCFCLRQTGLEQKPFILEKSAENGQKSQLA
jgi:hypothetical protein